MATERRWIWGIALAVVLLGAAWLRLYQLRDVPAGLFCDEAAFGYNGYAISQSGYDENGKFLPLLVWSFGGYKNTVYIYSTALAVKIFGLDEFSTRLPAAFYGVLSIAVVYLIGKELFNPWVGLFSAVFLALAPWHLHMSRIAFEMTPFAFLFGMAVWLLILYTKGRRTLPWAAFFCAACPYNYAISTVVVPLFLVGFALLYAPTLLRRWKETLLAIVVGILTIAPLVAFYQRNPQGAIYLQRTTAFDWNAPWLPQARRYWAHYKAFFDPVFLFQRGDPITRHAVREFGELLPIYMPFLLIGIAAALLRRDRFSKLLLWWLAVYPTGAALLTEIPSATRAFIGVPAFCLLTGLGLATALWIAKILRWQPLVRTVQAVGLVVAGYFLAQQSYRYVTFYFNEYPKYSAPTYGGFQYGYRDSIHFMEPLRPQYQRLMLTATEVNQPQIFPLFYNRVDPLYYIRTRDIGYLIADPAFYSEYTIDGPILYQLRESDLAYFSDYTILKDIIAPGGQKEFVIAEVRARRMFLTQWLVLGLFGNSEGGGIRRDFIDPTKISKDRVRTAFGDAYWRPMFQRNVRVDLNMFYAGSDPLHPGNPEYVCAYALTNVRSDRAQQVFLELAGGGDLARVWLNGNLLSPVPIVLGPVALRKSIDLQAGDNVLLVQSCESVGDWYFTARITDAEGKDVPGISAVAEIPTVTLSPAPPPADKRAEAVQLIEGFGEIKRFVHTQNPYPDYRGGTESWWAYVRDSAGEVVWTTTPVPEKKRTIAVLTASFSEVPFEGELYVDGKFALTFRLSPEFQDESWGQNGYRLRFLYRAATAGRSGVLLVEVPAEAMRPGEPLELRITPTGGDDAGWFMVKGYKDTLAHEGITAEEALSVSASGWEKTPPEKP
ncbi:MAG: glycosyltransferase family 39 protein [Candidatus Binatia bacterium]|nr:glycosyltransferase family 39 protein [Candidatus Binatia bacterium]